MKNRSMTFFKQIFGVALLLASTGTVYADNASEVRDEELDNLSFIEMLNSVPLGKNADLVRKFQEKEGKGRLLNSKYAPKGGWNVEFFRNKEVLLVTIEADKLFAPNDTVLRHNAGEYLKPLTRYLKDPEMYRVLLVMHTDNTGSEQYRDNLTVKRVESVFDWFDRQGVDTNYMFDYALSDDMPLVPNNSMNNRARNRRLEVYLMPGKKMLEQAKKGRIIF